MQSQSTKLCVKSKEWSIGVTALPTPARCPTRSAISESLRTNFGVIVETSINTSNFYFLELHIDLPLEMFTRK